MKLNKLTAMIGLSLSMGVAPVFAETTAVDHSTMDHSQMDHSQIQVVDTNTDAPMDHSKMDHGKMAMSGMSGKMDHGSMQMAPAGIMKSNTHMKGGFMFSYGFMSMEMDGIKDGTNKVSNDDVFSDGYMMAPSKMSMKMHMLGAMYGMTDDLTLAVMAGYAEKDMDMIHKMMSGMLMTHSGDSSGITDTEVSVIDNLNRYGIENFVISYGVSLPTGDIDAKSEGKKLGYPMQLGSGTFDFLPSVTHQKTLTNGWGYGVQGRATIRIGNNSNDYRLGNKYAASTWVTKNLAKSFSLSGILDVAYSGNINGSDKDLMTNMSPSKDPNARESTVVTAGVSGRYNLGSGHNVLLRVDVPVYEDFAGPQLMTDYKLAFNYKKMF